MSELDYFKNERSDAVKPHEKFVLDIADNLLSTLKVCIRLHRNNPDLDSQIAFKSIVSGSFGYIGAVMDMLCHSLDGQDEIDIFLKECSNIFVDCIKTVREENL